MYIGIIWIYNNNNNNNILNAMMCFEKRIIKLTVLLYVIYYCSRAPAEI